MSRSSLHDRDKRRSGVAAWLPIVSHVSRGETGSSGEPVPLPAPSTWVIGGGSVISAIRVTVRPPRPEPSL